MSYAKRKMAAAKRKRATSAAAKKRKASPKKPAKKRVSLKQRYAAYKKKRVAKKQKRQVKRNVKKINKMVVKSYKKQVKKGVKKGVAIKKAQAKVKLPSNVHPGKVKSHGKIRRGAKSVTLTGGGAYASYKKKSGAAKSFRKSFAAARKRGAKTFKWDGRSYSTAVKKKAPAKKKK